MITVKTTWNAILVVSGRTAPIRGESVAKAKTYDILTNEAENPKTFCKHARVWFSLIEGRTGSSYLMSNRQLGCMKYMPFLKSICVSRPEVLTWKWRKEERGRTKEQEKRSRRVSSFLLRSAVNFARPSSYISFVLLSLVVKLIFSCCIGLFVTNIPICYSSISYANINYTTLCKPWSYCQYPVQLWFRYLPYRPFGSGSKSA